MAARPLVQPNDGLGDTHRILREVAGRNDRWRRLEDDKASVGTALDFKECVTVDAAPKFLDAVL